MILPAFSTTSAVARKAWKIEARAGTRTLTATMPVQWQTNKAECPTTWAIRPNGSWSSWGSMISPYMIAMDLHPSSHSLTMLQREMAQKFKPQPSLISQGRFQISWRWLLWIYHGQTLPQEREAIWLCLHMPGHFTSSKHWRLIHLLRMIRMICGRARPAVWCIFRQLYQF